MMKLSIITINYNNKDGLVRTINSVLSQSFRDFEWIVIDGGSSDGSIDIIEHNKDNFSYWISEPDKGVYNALNKGILKAQGEYLSFLNSGDEYESDDVLEKVFRLREDADIIYGNTINVYTERTEELIPPGKVTLKYFFKDTINHQSAFISRSLQLTHLYDEKYKICSDRKFWLQCVMEGARFHYINVTIAKYDHEGISSTHPIILEEEFDAIKKEEIPDNIRVDIEKLLEHERIITDYPVLPKIYRHIRRSKNAMRLILIVEKLMKLL